MAMLHATAQGLTDDGIPADQLDDYQAMVQDAENVLNVVLSRTAEDNTVSTRFASGNYADASLHVSSAWLDAVYRGGFGIKTGEIEQALER